MSIDKKTEMIFSEEKLRNDLHLYLDIEKQESFDIISEEEFSGLEKTINYSSSDSITLISINIIKKYHGIIYYPYQVEIGIGKFSKNPSLGLYSVDKCFATLFYDHQFNIITIDFFHRTFNAQ